VRCLATRAGAVAVIERGSSQIKHKRVGSRGARGRALLGNWRMTPPRFCGAAGVISLFGVFGELHPLLRPILTDNCAMASHYPTVVREIRPTSRNCVKADHRPIQWLVDRFADFALSRNERSQYAWIYPRTFLATAPPPPPAGIELRSQTVAQPNHKDVERRHHQQNQWKLHDQTRDDGDR